MTAAGTVDSVLREPQEMRGPLAARSPISAVQTRPDAPLTRTDLLRILALLRSETGHDFSHYKQTTILRGIVERMRAHNLPTAKAYARCLEAHPEEVRQLFRGLLIHVTQFFRDPQAFATLKRDVLPQLVSGLSANHVFHAWVPGCATGEEAYSLAILLAEAAELGPQVGNVRILATDIDELAVAAARTGVFPLSIARDVPDRRRRFFTPVERGYQIRQELRARVVFAVQNVAAELPAMRFDLISCRNLLIYLEPELQEQLIAAFHRVLRPGGVLLLSPSETIGNAVDLFTPINRKWKLYRANTFAPSAACHQAVAQAESGIIRHGGRAV